MKKTTVVWSIVIIGIVGGLISLLIVQGNKPGQYDKLAQCLTTSGATFYGAFWCPHCQAQKAMFGRSAKLLPYVECSEPSGKGQLPICNEKGIQGYPTWIFADGSQLSGEQQPATLAEKTNCPIQ